GGEGEALPGPDRQRGERRKRDHVRPTSRRKRRGRIAGAQEITRVDGLDRLGREALPEGGRLRAADGGQGNVGVSEEAALGGVEHLAVARQVHPGGRHQTSSRKSRLTVIVRV